MKLGWNGLVLLRNAVENFCSYGLWMHSRDNPDDQMTVIDLVEIVQRHADSLDALLAYAHNCFQVLNVCARTLRLYVIDYTYTWPEQEDLKGTIEEILDLYSRDHRPPALVCPARSQWLIASGLLADYSWMNEVFQLRNQSIDDMKQDIEQGERPGHVYLLSGDANFPRPVAAHRPWARCSRAGEPGNTLPEGPAHPRAPPATRATPTVPPQDFTEQGPKRTRTTSALSTRPTASSEAATSSKRPRPTVGSTTATPTTANLRHHRLKGLVNNA